MSRETFQKRDSTRTVCLKCGPVLHQDYYEPDQEVWFSVCSRCELVEFANDELESRSLTYCAKNEARFNPKERRLKEEKLRKDIDG